mmetsp:Transcript_26809/g.36858  ORF Transcript_26809/g.36858 Transcript_26809/m.36858 type:complete len:112 (+) Transcript_26809:104-439(+)
MIVYALCARGKSVLVEYTSTSGNFPVVTRVLLSKIPPQDGKMSYVYDRYVFHYVVECGITYLCMTNEKQTRRVPFAFLEDIRRRFKTLPEWLRQVRPWIIVSKLTSRNPSS